MTPWVWLLRLWCEAVHRAAYFEPGPRRPSRILCRRCSLACEWVGGRHVWTWQPRRRRCRHHGGKRTSFPAIAAWDAYLEGRITREEYGRRRNSLSVTTCLDCGKRLE